MKKTTTKYDELSPRAQRVVDAGKLLHGVEWMTKFALDVGCSKQMMGFIARNEKPGGDKIGAKVVAALKMNAGAIWSTKRRRRTRRATSTCRWPSRFGGKPLRRSC